MNQPPTENELRARVAANINDLEATYQLGELLRLKGDFKNAEIHARIAVRMIDNPDYRSRMIRRLKTADLDATLLSLEHVPAFVRAIDHLLKNHESLKKDSKRSPIVID